MFILPFAVAKLASECAGMALCMMLFLVINPLYSIILGIISGKNIKKVMASPYHLCRGISCRSMAVLWDSGTVVSGICHDLSLYRNNLNADYKLYKAKIICHTYPLKAVD